MHFPFITLNGMMLYYKRQYTDKTLTLRKCMYMRASELRKFWHFHIPKTAISFNIFVGTSHTLSQKHI